MGCCTSRPTYHILLKLPHGKQCFHSTGKEWVYEEDLHTILDTWYNTIYDDWVMYNDETPTHTSSTGAHAKGIVAWNRTTVTWLIHSVPRFPITFQHKTIASSELEYGQSFLFVKMPISHLENILTQVFVMHPTVYNSTIPYYMYTDLYKQKMIRDQEYILSKIRYYQNEKIRTQASNITDLPHIYNPNNVDSYIRL